jgi:hypothetical protein
VQGISAAEEVFGELKSFWEPINAEAFRSLQEAGEDLLALQRLNIPNTLHRSLLSTNAIENSFLNTRRKIARVTRFRAKTDQFTAGVRMRYLKRRRASKSLRNKPSHSNLSPARPFKVSTTNGASPIQDTFARQLGH